MPTIEPGLRANFKSTGREFRRDWRGQSFAFEQPANGDGEESGQFSPWGGIRAVGRCVVLPFGQFVMGVSFQFVTAIVRDIEKQGRKTGAIRLLFDTVFQICNTRSRDLSSFRFRFLLLVFRAAF